MQPYVPPSPTGTDSSFPILMVVAEQGSRRRKPMSRRKGKEKENKNLLIHDPSLNQHVCVSRMGLGWTPTLDFEGDFEGL